MTSHQYIDRDTFILRTEKLYLDRVITYLYSRVREDAPSLFRLLTSRRASSLIAFLNYDLFLSRRIGGIGRFLDHCGIDLAECIDPIGALSSPKRLFERKIRYWQCRPMPDRQDAVVSPADSRVLVGSLSEASGLFLKGKFFDTDELLGKPAWVEAFRGADFAIFRLTPDRYHYNHVPVSGKAVDIYELPGAYHSCNPEAVVTVVTPYSKNTRVVTVIDTDVPDGTRVGLVAMVEVTALMIGKVEQRYSENRYDDPRRIEPGMHMKKGCPKSVYAPGSSTDVLLFQPGRMAFDAQLVRNMRHAAGSSRFTTAFGKPLLETDVKVRSAIGYALHTGRPVDV